MKKRIAFFMAVLLVLDIIHETAFAAIPSNCQGTYLQGNYVVQEKKNWCWAATAENAVRWELWESLPNRTQKDAVKHLKGGIFDLYPDIGGSIYDIRDAAEYISINALSYTAIEDKKDFSFLCEEVYNSHPVMAGLCFYKSGEKVGGHAVLIVGWSTATGDDYLKYCDPETGNIESCSYKWFCNGNYGAIKYEETCYLSGF